MEDIEINDLAVKIIEGLKEDFQRLHYSELEGELKVIWGEEKLFNASAHSLNPPDHPPEHIVRLTYELARQIYRDAEDFYEFLNNSIQRYSAAFLTFEPPHAPPPPKSFPKRRFENSAETNPVQ